MDTLDKFISWWTIRKFGYLILLISIFLGILGYLGLHGFIFTDWKQNLLQDFYANFSTELFSLAITILIVDKLYENRATAEEKKRLILQIGSPNNAFAIEAVRQLRVKGWLYDGSLRDSILSYANLEGADLSYADLQGATLNNVNLKSASLHNCNFAECYLVAADFRGANIETVNFKKAKLSSANFQHSIIHNVQFGEADMTFCNLMDVRVFANVLEFLNPIPLSVAHSLRGTVLPDSSRYMGEYNLSGDLAEAKTMEIDINDQLAMEKYYREGPIILHAGPTSTFKSWVDEYKNKNK